MIESGLKIGGVVSFWTVGNWTSLATISQKLEDAGLKQYIPDARTPASCLRDSLEDVFPDRNLMVRPLKTKDGFAVVKEERGEDNNSYDPVCTVRIDPDSLRITMRPFDYDKAAKLGEHFNRYRGLLRPAQVATCLVSILGHIGGVRLRPSGAIYWLPIEQMGEWQKAVDAVESSGVDKPSCVYVLRHQMDHDAIRAVRDAVVEEVAEAAKKLHEEVVRGDLGERALHARQVLAEDLRHKVKVYEDILGVGLASLHDTISTAEQAAAAAVILAAAANQNAEMAGV